METTTLRIGGKLIRTRPVPAPNVDAGIVGMDALEAGDATTAIVLLSEIMPREQAEEIVRGAYVDEHGQTVTPLGSIRTPKGRMVVRLVQRMDDGRPMYSIKAGIGGRDWRSKRHALAYVRRMFAHPSNGAVWAPVAKA